MQEEITMTNNLKARNNRQQYSSSALSSSTSSPSNGILSSSTDPLYFSDPSVVNDKNDNNEKIGSRRHSKTHSSSFFVTTTFRSLWYQWKLLNTYSKIVLAFILFLLLQHIIISVWDHCFLTIGIIDNSEEITTVETKKNLNDTTTPDTAFAVVINTYKRPHMLKQAIQHYANTCGKSYGVGQVFVIWADQTERPPTNPESFYFDTVDDTTSSFSFLRRRKQSDIKNRSPIQIIKSNKDSLNSRFVPIPELQTTAIFMVDDDIRVSCSSLKMGFQAWKTHLNSMVGYYPRLASSKSIRMNERNIKQQQQQQQPGYIYHTWRIVYWKHTFNLVLTKACFLHSKYMEMYSNDEIFPIQIKSYIDNHKNCEDIAMSMLVANYTRYQSSIASTRGTTPARPIYIEGQVSDSGLLNGISSGSGHMATRSQCLTDLTTILQQHAGWTIPPFDEEFSLGENSWIQHSPGFWWQYKPSNFFEWL